MLVESPSRAHTIAVAVSDADFGHQSGLDVREGTQLQSEQNGKRGVGIWPSVCKDLSSLRRLPVRSACIYTLENAMRLHVPIDFHHSIHTLARQESEQESERTQSPTGIVNCKLPLNIVVGWHGRRGAVILMQKCFVRRRSSVVASSSIVHVPMRILKGH
jgi:hypothetical protein